MRRMGRNKWKNMMTELQNNVRKAKRVERLSETEYQSRIEKIAAFLRGVLNVIEHRGKKWPPRWPRERKLGHRQRVA